MAAESNIDYQPLQVVESDVSEFKNDLKYSVPITNVSSDTRIIWILRLLGGYEKWFIFQGGIQLLVFIYHLSNITFAITTLFSKGSKSNFTKGPLHCPEYQITLLFIQLQAAALYIVGYKSLNSTTCDIDNVLQRRFKIPQCKCGSIIVWSIVSLLFLFCVASGIIFLSQTKSDFWLARYYCQLILYILDMFKWAQTITMVLIIVGLLNTFPKELDVFETKIKKRMKGIDFRAAHKNESDTMTSGISKDSVRKPPVEMCKFGKDFDVNTFKMEFNQFTKGYETPMKQFHAYIVTFCICVTLMALLMGLTFIIVVSTDKQCNKNSDLMFFLIHHTSEILLYFVLWLIILIKLNRNHMLLKKYETDFILYVAMDSQDSTMVSLFLKTKLEEESPFSIYGFQPTVGKILIPAVSFIATLVGNAFKIKDAI